MRISCVKCGKGFESLIVDRELAWKELYGTSLKHTMRQHPEIAAKLQAEVGKLMVAASVFMTASETLVIPENEEFINKHLEGLQEIVMSAAGFDVDDVVEEEEEIDDDDLEEEIVEEIPNKEDDIKVLDVKEGKKEMEHEWPVIHATEGVPTDS